MTGKSLPRRGTTLVESILVIALLDVLIALLMPAIHRVRFRAIEDKSLTNCRSHAQILTTYTSDYKDCWPWLTSPTASRSIIRCVSRNEAFEARYFDVYRAWNIGLADGYYDGRLDDPSFAVPWSPGVPSFAEYLFPCSFLADPAFFRAETQEEPPRQLRATRAAEVTFPSAKSLVVAVLDDGQILARNGWAQTRFHLACVDGHAVARNFSQLTPSFGGDGLAAPSMSDHIGSIDEGPLHTLDGVAGRDLRN